MEGEAPGEAGAADRAFEPVIAAGEGQLFALQQPCNDVSRLSRPPDPRTCSIERDPGGTVLRLVPPGPQAHVEPSTGQQIECGGHLGHEPGVAQVVAEGERPQPNAVGSCRQRRQSGPALQSPLRIRRAPVFAPVQEQVVGHPQGIEPCRFRHAGDLGDVPPRREAAAERGVVVGKGEPESHLRESTRVTGGATTIDT